MIKKIFWLLDDLRWSFLCSWSFWLHGPYGLAITIEKLPFRYVIKYLKKYGATIGNNSVIDTGIIIHRPDKEIPFKNLSIGDNCYIGRKVLFDLSDQIIVEHDVAIGTGCQFWTHVGDFKKNLTDRENDYREEKAPIKVKKRTVIYSAAVISPGVTIGKYARVGACSLVNKNVTPKSFFGGVPARFVKMRDNDQNK